MFRTATLALAFTAFSAGAAAQQSAPPQGIPADAARRMVEACAAHATAKGQSHAIAVVDGGGQLLAAWRMDGNGFGIMDFALAKARAAAAWGFPTSRMLAAAQQTPGFGNAPNVVTVGGGVPVYDATGQVRLGGIGVSGAAPEDDAACAEAAISAVGLQSTRIR